MERETQVVHAIIAAGETEVDVASAELNSLNLVVCMLVFADDWRIVDWGSALAFQYTALNPYLISTRQHGDIIEQDGVVAHVSKEQKACDGVEQGL